MWENGFLYEEKLDKFDLVGIYFARTGQCLWMDHSEVITEVLLPLLQSLNIPGNRKRLAPLLSSQGTW